jgi:hypothetical protein
MATVVTYALQFPAGNEVALAVLDCLCDWVGMDPMARHMDKAQVARDCEAVAMALAVRRFGPASVFSGPRRRKSVLSRTFWPRAWPEEYQAIQIRNPPSSPERIVLDTSVVRGIVHGDGNSLDLKMLLARKGEHPVSLSVLCCQELCVALVDGRIGFEEWAMGIPLLDEVLDPHRPVVPGIATVFAPHLSERTYYETRLLLRHAKHVEQLKYGLVYVAEDGNPVRVRVDPTARKTLRDFGDRYLERLGSASGIRGPLEIEDIVADTKLKLELVMGRDPGGMDLWVRCAALRLIEVKRSGAAPSPNRHNDGVDDAMLGLVEGSVLCTSDERLKKRVDRSTSFDAWRVMLPDRLLDWLAAAPISWGS